jgi:hypothetical protein
MSRLDPLVVDQVVLSGLAEDPNGLRAKLLKRFPQMVDSPFTFISEKGEYFTVGVFPKSVDIMVVHPVYPVKDGRPSWLTSLAGRQPLAPPGVGKPIPSDRLFLAKRPGVKTEIVPVDAILVRAGELVPALMVPEGKFEIEALEF